MTKYLSVAEAAEFLGVKIRMVGYYCQKRGLGTKSGSRYIITMADVKKFKKLPVGNPCFQPKKKVVLRNPKKSFKTA